MPELNDWDTTAANNNDAPPDGWPENTMQYSEVNNTGREGMAVLARFWGDVNGSLQAGGVADAYTVTLNSAYTAYFQGMYFALEILATNTGASTINVNGIGIQSITDRSGAALSAGELQSGGIYELRYDGTNFQLMGTVAGAVNIDSAILTNSNNIDLVDTDVALNVGAADPDTQQHLEFDQNAIQSKGDATTAGTLNLNPEGGTVIVNNGGSGQALFDLDAPTGIDTRLRFLENGTTEFQTFWDASAGAFKLRATTAGDFVRIEEGNGVNISAEFTPNAGVELRFANVLRLQTTAVGATVTGPSGGDAFLDVNGDGTNDVFLRLTSVGGSGGVALFYDEANDRTDISQTDNAGLIEEPWIRMDEDAGVGLYFNGTRVFETNAANQVTLGDSSAEHFIRFRAPATGLDAAGNSALLAQYESSAGAYLPLIRKAADNGGIVFSADEGIALASGEGGSALITNETLTAEDVTLYADAAIRLISSGQAYADRVQLDFTSGLLSYNANGTGDDDLLIQADAGNLVLNAGSGAVTLQDNGSARIVTTASGNTFNGTLQDMTSGVATATDLRLRNSEGGVRFRVDGDDFTINQTNASGTAEDLWATFNNNGSMLLYNNGNDVFETDLEGITVRHGNAAVPTIRFEDSTSTLHATIAASAGFLTINGAVNSQEISMGTNDSGGIGRTAFIYDPDGGGGRYMEIGAGSNGIVFYTQQRSSNTNTSGAKMADHAGTNIDVGFNLAPVIEADSSRTFAETEVSKMIHRDTTGAVTYTLPSGTSGAVPPLGSMIMIANENTGTCTVSASGTLRWFQGAGAAPQTGNRTLARDAIVTVYHYASSEWWIWGAGIS